MNNNHSALMVIPARGGSKGILGKNLVPLLGRPLLAWTVDAAAQARRVERTVVSTDEESIAEVARSWGAEVPFLRPQELAGDNTHSTQVVRHALEWLAENEGFRPDIVGMLLPTSPFRTEWHLDQAVDLLVREKAPAVVGVTRMRKHPAALRVLRDGGLFPLIKADTLNVQRQDGEPLYFVNGSLYLSWTEGFLADESFHVPGALPYVLEDFDAIDIDSEEDLQKAEILGKKFFGKYGVSPDREMT
jgi:CMP-N,N'-diacetyllegionaminic acid synthase